MKGNKLHGTTADIDASDMLANKGDRGKNDEEIFQPIRAIFPAKITWRMISARITET